MMHRHHEDSLSPERMQLFMAGLAGLPPEEVRKAKILYLRNAIAEYKAAAEATRGIEDRLGFFGGRGCLSQFLPMSGVQRRLLETNRRLQAEKIQNAIDVWKGDLKGETFDF